MDQEGVGGDGVGVNGSVEFDGYGRSDGNIHLCMNRGGVGDIDCCQRDEGFVGGGVVQEIRVAAGGSGGGDVGEGSIKNKVDINIDGAGGDRTGI